MRTRIKFCGMTRVEDVRAAAALGVDAVGLVFAPGSRRTVSLEQGLALRRAAGPLVSVVALVMDNEVAEVEAICRTLKPDLLQFHGSETEADCRRHGLPWLKAVPMGDDIDVAEYLSRYASASGFVFDAHAAGAAGGSGRRFDWSRIPRGLDRPWLLAGGLGPDTVGEAVRAARPFAVDVSSGIEASPGAKDLDRMRRFVAEVGRADSGE